MTKTWRVGLLLLALAALMAMPSPAEACERCVLYWFCCWACEPDAENGFDNCFVNIQGKCGHWGTECRGGPGPLEPNPNPLTAEPTLADLFTPQELAREDLAVTLAAP